MTYAREVNIIAREYTGCWLIRASIWAVPGHGGERTEPMVMEKWVDQADLDNGDLGWALDAVRQGLTGAVSALYAAHPYE